MQVVFNALSLLLIGLIAAVLVNRLRQSSARIDRLLSLGSPAPIVVKVLSPDNEPSRQIDGIREGKARPDSFIWDEANLIDERGDNGWPIHVIRYIERFMFRSVDGLWEHNFLSALEGPVRCWRPWAKSS